METFGKPADELVRQLSQGDWPEKMIVGGTEFTVHKLTPKFGWVRLEGVYHTRYPYPRTDQSVYVRGTLNSGSKRRATLRLGLDDWAMVYLNGQRWLCWIIPTSSIPLRFRSFSTKVPINF